MLYSLTVQHPVLNVAINRVSLAMKELMEREDSTAIMAGTNVTYPGVITARSALGSADVMNTAMIISIVAKLKMRGAAKFLPDGCTLVSCSLRIPLRC